MALTVDQHSLTHSTPQCLVLIDMTRTGAAGGQNTNKTVGSVILCLLIFPLGFVARRRKSVYLYQAGSRDEEIISCPLRVNIGSELGAKVRSTSSLSCELIIW